MATTRIPTLKPPDAVTEVAGLGSGCHTVNGVPVDEWGSVSPNVNNSAGYYRDPFGRVHLQGIVSKCFSPPSGDTIFTLPPGYRPVKLQHHGTVSSDAFGAVNVDSSGNVFAVAGNYGNAGWISLDGISFRCGPSGSNGCR